MARCDPSAPDECPIFAYDCSEAEKARLGRYLPFRVAASQALDSTAQRFVLWAGDHIRSGYRGGTLRWQFVFDGLGMVYHREVAIALTERGLVRWGDRCNARRRATDCSHIR